MKSFIDIRVSNVLYVLCVTVGFILIKQVKRFIGLQYSVYLHIVLNFFIDKLL